MLYNIYIFTIYQKNFIKTTDSYYQCMLKRYTATHGKPISEPRAVTCPRGSHSVTCHPTQVNASHLNPSQASGIADT